MAIPSTPVPTTQLDQNSGQLPGVDTTDSAREQLLLAIQQLNSIINQYGGAEMLTDANAVGANVAFTDLANVFSELNIISLLASGTTAYLQLVDSVSGKAFNISLGDSAGSFRLVNPSPGAGGSSTPLRIDDNALQLLADVNGINYGGNRIAYLNQLPPRGYSCALEANGLVKKLPNGWNASRLGPGKYRVNHFLNLGVDNYSVTGNGLLNTASPWNPGMLVQVLENNYFEYSMRDSSGASLDAAAVMTLYPG